MSSAAVKFQTEISKEVNCLMNKVIITGADGFVGSHTTREFLENGCHVLAVSRSAELKNLKKHDHLTHIVCNVFDTKELLTKLPKGEYDAFIHFAWMGASGEERINYNLQMKNALGTVECMKIAKEIGCKRFLCAGTIMEYEIEAAIHTQGSHPGMGYIYGMGKHIAHCICKSVAASIGIDLLWPMITNAYGVGELSPRFINTTLRKMIMNEPLQFTAATQNYDFIYVTDVAKAFYLIAQKGIPFHEYMIGSGNARPLKEFILEMQQALAPELTPLFGDVPFTGTNIPLSTFSIDNIKRDTGFVPQISFTEGTRRTMEWLKTL